MVASTSSRSAILRFTGSQASLPAMFRFPNPAYEPNRRAGHYFLGGMPAEPDRGVWFHLSHTSSVPLSRGEWVYRSLMALCFERLPTIPLAQRGCPAKPDRGVWFHLSHTPSDSPLERGMGAAPMSIALYFGESSP